MKRREKKREKKGGKHPIRGEERREMREEKNGGEPGTNRPDGDMQPDAIHRVSMAKRGKLPPRNNSLPFLLPSPSKIRRNLVVFCGEMHRLVRQPSAVSH